MTEGGSVVEVKEKTCDRRRRKLVEEGGSVVQERSTAKICKNLCYMNKIENPIIFSLSVVNEKNAFKI